ncbi:MAG: acyl-CoA thioesterase [Pirellulales bacterium]|nr:acyl-CoA thioesterase [Pirellulales bacterium]
MSEVFQTERIVEFHHTDAARIMHFATYFLFMEEAEHAFLRHLGMSVMGLYEGTKLSWPRVSAKCDYTDSVGFEDVVTINVRVGRLGSKSVTYSHRLFHDSRPIAEGEITVVCCLYDDRGDVPRSIVIPDTIRERLQPYVTKS